MQHNCRVWAKANPYVLVEKTSSWPKKDSVLRVHRCLRCWSFIFWGNLQILSSFWSSGQYAAVSRNNIIPHLQQKQVLHSITFIAWNTYIHHSSYRENTEKHLSWVTSYCAKGRQVLYVFTSGHGSVWNLSRHMMT